MEKAIVAQKGSDTQQCTVGVVEDGVYCTVRLPNHYFKNEGGFGISITALDDLRLRNVGRIKLIYKDAGGERVFSISLSDFIEKSKVIYYPPADVQRVCGTVFMDEKSVKRGHPCTTCKYFTEKPEEVGLFIGVCAPQGKWQKEQLILSSIELRCKDYTKDGVKQ